MIFKDHRNPCLRFCASSLILVLLILYLYTGDSDAISVNLINFGEYSLSDTTI